MDLFYRFRLLFGNEKCERTIRYDTRTIVIGKIEADVPPVEFSLGDFKTEVKKIRDASEFSELLDSYQYEMCKICKALGKDDEEWKKYNKIRVCMVNLLTSFQGTLIAFKSDPNGQNTRLNDIVGRLQDYVLLVIREILPNISDLESKTTVSKGDVPEVNSRTVSKALEIGGLEETDVNQFVEELKLEQ